MKVIFYIWQFRVFKNGRFLTLNKKKKQNILFLVALFHQFL